MRWLIGIIFVLFVASGIHGWFSEKSRSLREDEYNRKLRQELLNQAQNFESEMVKLNQQLEKRKELVAGLRREFDTGYVKGRKWLAAFIAEADRALDDSISLNLRNKSHPAPKASDEVSAARAERRAYKERVKFLEYQLKSYEEYFPFLVDYKELILDEAVSFSSTANNLESLGDIDPVLLFVPKAEYDHLASTERNQLALDRYLSKTLSPVAVGRLYERYLGYLHECED
jgi:nitrogen fixation/metabolism regulation signal transduction histidine kinase